MKLSKTRNLRKLYSLKMQNKTIPTYLSNSSPLFLFMPCSILITTKQVTARTQRYAYSFFPSKISAWKSLPTSAKTADSLYTFKRLIWIPAYFNIGRRQLQILQTQEQNVALWMSLYFWKTSLFSSLSSQFNKIPT